MYKTYNDLLTERRRIMQSEIWECESVEDVKDLRERVKSLDYDLKRIEDSAGGPDLSDDYRLNTRTGHIELIERSRRIHDFVMASMGIPTAPADGEMTPIASFRMATAPENSVNTASLTLSGQEKAIFRSGEKVSSVYNVSSIDADKCLRAAITGNYSDLNDAEKRSVTPSTAGAILAPAISSILIDNLRQSDWMQIFKPTMVMMDEGEVKIPNLAGLPTTVMHTAGEEETPTDPVISAAILNAQTFMALVEVANELLQDSRTSQGAILQACINSISNKLLQQVLYGTGTAPEIKGITTYPANAFADAGDKSTDTDLFKLATLADTAIIKSNGIMDAMMYDPNLEDRLNKRLATGELVEPSRAFKRLSDAGRILAHPSIAEGDMLFMQSDALFIGMRRTLEVQIDPYSAFNSNNTKFRVILRADTFANTPRMVYYSNIPAVEPTP